MKKGFYFLFKNQVYKRTRGIYMKQKFRRECVQKARDYIKEWSDIPTTDLIDSLSGICRVPDKEWLTKEYVYYLTIPDAPDYILYSLSLDWFDRKKENVRNYY